MTTEELLSYIKKQSADGSTKEQISESLIGAGWTMVDVDEAFTEINAQTPVSPPTKEISTSPEVKTKVEGETPQNFSKRKPFEQSPAQTSSEKNASPNIWQNEEESHKSKKVGIIFVAVALFVLVGAGGAYAYFSFFQKLAPYEVLTRMVEASQQIGASKFESDFSMNFQVSSKEAEVGKVDMKITTKGAKDISSLKDSKADFNANIEFDASAGFFGINLNLDADIKILDNVVYVRLNKISDLPMPVDLSDISGKWIKIDQTGLKDAGGQVGFESQNLDKILEENKEKQKKIFKKLADLFKDIEQIINRSVLEGGDKKIDGTSVYHYIVKVSPKDAETLFDSFVEIAIEASEKGEIDIDEIEKFKQSEGFKQMIDILTEIDLQMWIGKKDFLQYKTAVKLELVDKKIADKSREKARQAVIKASLSGIRPSAELFYDDNKYRYGDNFELGLCPDAGSSNIIFAKDKNIISAVKSIKNAKGKEVSCVAVGDSVGAHKYAISAVFGDGSGGWCVDSSGFWESGSAGEDGECGEYASSTSMVVPNDYFVFNGDISFVYSASDYGESVVVETPEISVSIEELLKEITEQ